MQVSSYKATVLDAEAVRRSWRRIAHEVLEHQPDIERLCVFGIVTRGLPLAELRRLQAFAAGLVQVAIGLFVDYLLPPRMW